MYKSWFNTQCRIAEFELAYSKWLEKWDHIHTVCYILLGKSKLEKYVKLPLLKYIIIIIIISSSEWLVHMFRIFVCIWKVLNLSA